MKKIIIFLFMDLFLNCGCMRAMQCSNQLALQQKAFDDFIDIKRGNGYGNSYDKEHLLAYITQADTDTLNTERSTDMWEGERWTCMHAACIWNDADVLALLLSRPGIDKNPLEHGGNSSKTHLLLLHVYMSL